MAAAAGPPILLQRVFDGCIAAFDTDVRRRPYHRNCSCALHEAQRSSNSRRPLCACSGEVSFRSTGRCRDTSGGSLSVSGQGRKICSVEISKSAPMYTSRVKPSGLCSSNSSWLSHSITVELIAGDIDEVDDEHELVFKSFSFFDLHCYCIIIIN
ncbi:hypothetical protein Cni_G03056 [Canna indica]|uniref:Uncharacterized protein n=1 Tax=Canna indica TaxID=4628 RepID=A0AAQ3JQD7_9LILI|nr:hypothetical protein Cni_G03056 [Canna indica]